MKNIKKWELAYIAGFFDGEGYIALLKKKYNKGNIRSIYINKKGERVIHREKKDRHVMILWATITQNTCRDKVLYWIEAKLRSVDINCKVYVQRKMPNGESLSKFLIIRKGNVNKFIQLIYPYIIAKKEQVDKVMKLYQEEIK